MWVRMISQVLTHITAFVFVRNRQKTASHSSGFEESGLDRFLSYQRVGVVIQNMTYAEGSVLHVKPLALAVFA